MAEPDELEEPDELDDGEVGQRALPVTGTTGVPVPEAIGVLVPRLLMGVEVPKAPPPLSGVDVPAPVLGERVPVLEEPGVDVPEPSAEVASSVETEVETEVEALSVPKPVTGIAAVPVAELEGAC